MASEIDADDEKTMRIDAREMHYRELNQRVREAVAAGEKAFDLANVNGQRYIADGVQGEVEFDIHGVPGNDLGAFMDGPTIRVHGNAQDAVVEHDERGPDHRARPRGRCARLRNARRRALRARRMSATAWAFT